MCSSDLARWLQWNESLQMRDAFSAPPPPAPVTEQGTDRYLTNCFNNLWGGQIGIDSVLLGAAGMTRVEGLVKGGAYYNNAVARTTASVQGVDPYSVRAATPCGAAFVGELGMTCVVPLRRNLDFRVGYLALWLEGLSQPTNQYARESFDPAEIGRAHV